jgi:hypothetical protein
VNDVVGVAPALRAVAPRKPTSTIPNDERSPDGCRHGGCPPADVERLGTASSNDPAHARVARDPPGILGGDPVRVAERCEPGHARSSLQHGQVERYGDVWAFAANHPSVGRVQIASADLTESICPPLRRSAVITVGSTRIRIEGRSKRDEDRLPRLRIQVPVETHHAVERCRDEQASALEPPTRRVVGGLAVAQ